MMMEICGIGAVTGYGWGKKALWDGMMSGKPAATLYPGYGPDGEDAWLAKVHDEGRLGDGPTRYSRALRFAARAAVADAHERGWKPGNRVGLIHAAVSDVEAWRDFYLRDGGRQSVYDFMNMMPSTPLTNVMMEFGFHGPVMTASAGCASATFAMITAQMWLDAGIVDDVLLLSTDLSTIPEAGFHLVRLGAVVVDAPPLEACRPFQEGSRGMCPGEAAIGMVLTKPRLSTPGYVKMLGGAMSHDSFHVVSIDMSREHVDQCVWDALDAADVSWNDIAYVNAHGTGTAQCDAVETGVLDDIFESRPWIFSLKPLVGHCITAAAAVEVAIAALSYEYGIIPAPPIVSAEHHRRLLDGPTKMEPGLTLKMSLGMGGHNSAIVLGR